ncbi:MAG: hypothetical protein CVV24_11690 [Ignavibacteriae bacterium HGW-Ignavibacteriae-3]|nr:MAG: hypothetical protein CVV24_11690 [Ignavibacteriae bacterium HGW-Ignavibacteriae-3]
MRRALLILFISVCPLFSQNVAVVEDVEVTSAAEGNFFYPALSPDGSGILFSRENRQGLWYKNFSSNAIAKISDAPAAGYDPAFNEGNNEIIFREDDFSNGRRISSLVSYNLLTNKSAVLEEGIRDLKICSSNGNFNYYLKESDDKPVSIKSSLKKNSSSDIVVDIENTKIIVYDNNVKRILDPLGDGNYIWPSLSPDKTKLVFTCAGKGTYVSNLEGKVLTKIGYANYPSWSPDGNWIVFMKDIDDGVKVISSDIIITDLNSGKFFNLTIDKDNISMYPVWGTTNSDIYYNTNAGQIRKIKLKYE